MPGRMRFRTALAQMRGDHRPEVVYPAAHGLVRDRDPALRQQILDVTKAEREPEIEPNPLMYDLGREPISGVTDFPHTLGYSAYLHPTSGSGVTKPLGATAGAVRSADPQGRDTHRFQFCKRHDSPTRREGIRAADARAGARDRR